MKKKHNPFRKLKKWEREQIQKMAQRGHKIATTLLAREEDGNDELLVSYSTIGNFTVANVALGQIGYNEYSIKAVVTGASKKHPDDERDDEVGRQIALARAVKGEAVVRYESSGGF